MIMNTIVFDKDERVKAIDLGTLKQTISLAEYSGKLPRTRPIEHYDFIDMIGDKATAKGYNIQLDPIYVAKAEAKRLMTLDPHKVGTPESFLFNRLVTRVNIIGGGFEDHRHNTAIAIGYTDKGLQVGFGTNVKACQNMSIFGGRLHMTYGKQSVPWDKLVELINAHIAQLPDICESDTRLLSQMMDREVNSSEVITTLGKMHIESVKNTYFDGDFALNIGQTSQFTKGILKDAPDVLEHGEPILLYDFYNVGTRILHPDTAETTAVWPSNRMWGDFVVEHFNLQ
jgi:hypothetical protein